MSESNGNKEMTKTYTDECRCIHCHKKIQFRSSDIIQVKDSIYGIIQTIRCPYCQKRTILH